VIRQKTRGIILRRTDFKEVDKIVVFLSEDFGRVSALVKGVRKQTSRMAGGIEPFTVSKIEFLATNKDLKTIVSARIETRFENIIKEYDRAELGGEMLRALNSSIEDDVDSSYFQLATELLSCLNDLSISKDSIEVWFRLKLLNLHGRQPELRIDSDGKELEEGKTYHFDPRDGNFRQSDIGNFDTDAIRSWRVLTLKSPRQAKQVKGLEEALQPTVDPLRIFMAENSF